MYHMAVWWHSSNREPSNTHLYASSFVIVVTGIINPAYAQIYDGYFFNDSILLAAKVHSFSAILGH